MDKEKKIYKVKCKHCKIILSDEIQSFQTCKCGKLMLDTANLDCVRILGNAEDFEIIT